MAPYRSRSRVRAAGVAATVGFLGIAGFQAVLALGVPWGKAAWGGGAAELSAGLRIGSGVAVFIWTLAAAIVFQRSGLGDAHLRATLVKRATWILFGLILLGSLMNWASRSEVERYTWGPITLVMAVLCFIVARGAEPQDR